MLSRHMEVTMCLSDDAVARFAAQLGIQPSNVVRSQYIRSALITGTSRPGSSNMPQVIAARQRFAATFLLPGPQVAVQANVPFERELGVPLETVGAQAPYVLQQTVNAGAFITSKFSLHLTERVLFGGTPTGASAAGRARLAAMLARANLIYRGPEQSATKWIDCSAHVGQQGVPAGASAAAKPTGEASAALVYPGATGQSRLETYQTIDGLSLIYARTRQSRWAVRFEPTAEDISVLTSCGFIGGGSTPTWTASTNNIVITLVGDGVLLTNTAYDDMAVDAGFSSKDENCRVSTSDEPAVIAVDDAVGRRFPVQG